MGRVVRRARLLPPHGRRPVASSRRGRCSSSAADLTLHTLTQRYEQQFAAVNTELVEKRQALLESHRRVSSLNEQLETGASDKVAEQAALVEQWRAEVLDARHQLLTTRDHVVGTEAEVARLTRDNAQLRARAQQAPASSSRNVRGRLKQARLRHRSASSRKNRQLADEAAARRSRAPRSPAGRVRKAAGRIPVNAPLFSIVTPVYDPPVDVLGDTIASVLAQDFDDWEWILVDDCSPTEAVRELIREHAASDPRIRLVERETNGHIVAASNDGIDAARGEFIVLLDHDDLLTPDALSANAGRIAEHDDVDYLYSDEDKVDDEGNLYDEFRKPDWSPERLRGQMYTSHLSVMRTEVVRRVGGFREGYDGSQDHDLAPAGRRGGPSGRPHPRGALPLASRRRVGVGRHQRQALRHDRRRQRRAGPHGPSRARRRGRPGTGAGALPGHPSARPRATGLDRHPDHRAVRPHLGRRDA